MSTQEEYKEFFNSPIWLEVLQKIEDAINVTVADLLQIGNEHSMDVAYKARIATLGEFTSMEQEFITEDEEETE